MHRKEASGRHVDRTDAAPANPETMLSAMRKFARTATATLLLAGVALAQEGRDLTPYLGALRNPAKRAAQLEALAAKGRDGAQTLQACLKQLDPHDSGAAIEAVLRNLATMGPEAVGTAKTVHGLLREWPSPLVLSALRTMADLAPFDYVAVKGGDCVFESVEVDGRAVPTEPKASTGAFMFELDRLEHRGAVYGKTKPEQLLAVLTETPPKRRRLTSLGHRRDGALDLLLARKQLPKALHTAVENILREPQPTLHKTHWVNPQSVAMRPERSEPLLRPKAAKLLITRAGASPAALSAHAWILQSKHATVAQRMRAAMALGTLEWRGAERTEVAVRALMAGAKGKEIRVAREAVTAIGMHGKAAILAFPTLEELVDHADTNLRKRARVALQTLREAIR